MVTTQELGELLESELNALGSNFNFKIGIEVERKYKLPNNIKNWAKVDNNIYGVFTTNSGQFEAVQDQDLATIDTRLSLYVTETQMQEVYDILSQYQTLNNAKVFSIGDYSVVPVFDAIRPATTSIFQGDNRLPIEMNITYTIARKGILSNDIEVSINGIRQLVLSASFNMAKSVSNNLYNGNSTIKAKANSKSRTFTITIVNTNSDIVNQLKREIVTDDLLDSTYSITYNDGAIDTTSQMLLQVGALTIDAGLPAQLELVFTRSRE